MKICIKCDIPKPNDRFNLESICKLCEKEILETRKERHQYTSRNSNYKKNYKIDIPQYERMLDSQEGRCLICNKHKSLFNKRLAVDHCHTTGYARAILCTKCNTALGLLEENPEIIENLLKYSKRNKESLDYVLANKL